MTTPRRTPGPPQRGGTPVARRGSVSKPVCPTHGSEMAYDPSRMVWACQDRSCKMIALPKEDVDQGKGKPRIGEGILEIVRQTSPDQRTPDRYLLRAPDNNVLLDITPYVSRIESINDIRGSTSIVVTLRINNITELGR